MFLHTQRDACVRAALDSCVANYTSHAKIRNTHRICCERAKQHMYEHTHAHHSTPRMIRCVTVLAALTGSLEALNGGTTEVADFHDTRRGECPQWLYHCCRLCTRSSRIHCTERPTTRSAFCVSVRSEGGGEVAVDSPCVALRVVPSQLCVLLCAHDVAHSSRARRAGRPRFSLHQRQRAPRPHPPIRTPTFKDGVTGIYLYIWMTLFCNALSIELLRGACVQIFIILLIFFPGVSVSTDLVPCIA